MKKFLIIGAVLATLTVSAASAQQRLVRLTRYEGQRITGVSASSAFDVQLVQSAGTKVVAEINEELEGNLNLSLGSDGIVRVSLNSMGVRNFRTRNSVLKVTVYLPELTYLKGSGAAEFYANGNFNAPRTEIILGGAAELKSLQLRTGTLKLNCSGSAEAALRCEADKADIQLGGAAEGDLFLRCDEAAVQLSGAAELNLTGEAGRATMNVTSASELDAVGFAVKRLNVSTASAGEAKVWAIDALEAKATSASSIRYKGNPGVFDTQSSSAGSVRRID